jgi:hypothetical protein
MQLISENITVFIVQCMNGFFPASKTRFNFWFYLQKFGGIIRENKGTVARDESADLT